MSREHRAGSVGSQPGDGSLCGQSRGQGFPKEVALPRTGRLHSPYECQPGLGFGGTSRDLGGPHLTLTVSEGAAEGPILADTAAAVLGEYSPWGQLPGLLFESQGEAPGQRELGAGAGSGGHTRAIVKQLPSRAVTDQLAGFLRAEGARLQVRAEAWARGGTGAEQLARWALRAGPQVAFLLLLRVLGLARRTAGTLLAAPMPLGGAPTTGSRAVAPG